MHVLFIPQPQYNFIATECQDYGQPQKYTFLVKIEGVMCCEGTEGLLISPNFAWNRMPQYRRRGSVLQYSF